MFQSSQRWYPTDMLIGYARVSTADQQPQLQLDALNAAGCDRIFTDHGISGAEVAKPELEKAISFVRPDQDVGNH